MHLRGTFIGYGECTFKGYLHRLTGSAIKGYLHRQTGSAIKGYRHRLTGRLAYEGTP